VKLGYLQEGEFLMSLLPNLRVS